MSSEDHHIPLLKPRPRRPFELSSSSADSSVQSSPQIGAGSRSSTDDSPLETSSSSNRADVSSTRSFLNLTSSTLFGIYGPTAGTSQQPDTSQPPTPWGTGAETPVSIRELNTSIEEYSSNGRPVTTLDLSRVRTNNAAEIERRLLEKDNQRLRRHSLKAVGGRSPVLSPAALHHIPPSKPHILLQALVRLIVLFTFGVCYGALVAHLHSNRHIQVAPIEVRGINRASWRYLVFWGLAGVGIGNLLPWIDSAFEALGTTAAPQAYFDGNEDQGRLPRKRGLAGVEWSDVVRGVGAFVGIAFAIRKLAWSSTLQLSLTLALANPFLWYLLDRTPTGFTLSTAIGFLGTIVLFFVNPSVIPPPTSTNSAQGFNATAVTSPSSMSGSQGLTGGGWGEGKFPGFDALMRSEGVGVATWIASVLFCSCVCFGSIGRLLVREQARTRTMVR